MSRVATPAEKVLATVGIFRALCSELDITIKPQGPMAADHVVAALIEASVRIAMATDTRDMGILGTDGEYTYTAMVDADQAAALMNGAINEAVEE